MALDNGTGPTVLVMAGNHGDEYEGQVLVSQLVRQLQPDMIRGPVILAPMINFPAAQAGTRTSPIDGGNLNRSFPGDASGSVTERIAHFVEEDLVRRCSLVIDLHSGGSSLMYNGPTLLAEPRDDAERSRVHSLVSAFGLPRAFLHAPNPVTISSAARRKGAISIVTELGGAGMINPAASAHYVYARDDGLFEPMVELGDNVVAGQAVARIHFPETPWRSPETVSTVGGGEIICKRVPAMSRRGDCLFQLAQDDVEA